MTHTQIIEPTWAKGCYIRQSAKQSAKQLADKIQSGLETNRYGSIGTADAVRLYCMKFGWVENGAWLGSLKLTEKGEALFSPSYSGAP